MSNNNHSINEFDFHLICEYFSSTNRQGPGSESCTLKAFSFLTDLPAMPRIADLGCGTGSSALTLAKHFDVHITAIDLFPEFIEKLKLRAEKIHVTEKILPKIGDMASLDFMEESMDAIWSEGAIYNIGFERGVKEWYHFIKPGGYIAITDATWLMDNRPKEIEDFWMEAYPEIDTLHNRVVQMEKSGYKDVKTFVLPEECWTKEFYLPQRRAQEIFLSKYPDNATAHALVSNQRREAELYAKYKDFYGYVFYIGQK